MAHTDSIIHRSVITDAALAPLEFDIADSFVAQLAFILQDEHGFATAEDAVDTMEKMVFDLRYDSATRDYECIITDPDGFCGHLDMVEDQKTFRADYSDPGQVIYRAKTLEDLVEGINSILDEGCAVDLNKAFGPSRRN